MKIMKIKYNYTSSLSYYIREHLRTERSSQTVPRDGGAVRPQHGGQDGADRLLEPGTT